MLNKRVLLLALGIFLSISVISPAKDFLSEIQKKDVLYRLNLATADLWDTGYFMHTFDAIYCSRAANRCRIEFSMSHYNDLHTWYHDACMVYASTYTELTEGKVKIAQEIISQLSDCITEKEETMQSFAR